MRSVKSRLLSAWAWAAPVLTAALPGDHGNHNHGATQTASGSSVLGMDLRETYAQATFSITCGPGCLTSQGDTSSSRDDESLVLDFSTFAAQESCGESSNITLNGIHLPQAWHRDTASGVASLPGPAPSTEHALAPYHDLDIEWESACLRPNKTNAHEVQFINHLHSPSQLLTVVIKGVDGRPLQHPTGFTISFKQTSPPELLRFEGTPNPSASSEAHAEDWRAPPPHLRLPTLVSTHQPLTPSSRGSPESISLDQDLRELRILEAEAQELKGLIEAKRKFIQSHLNNEANQVASELRDCENVTCLLKVIKHKAHSAWRLLVVQFRPERSSPGAGMGGPNDPYQQVWRPSTHAEATIKADSLAPPPSYDEAELPIRPTAGSADSPESAYLCVLKIVIGVLCCGCLVGLIRHQCSSPRPPSEPTVDEECNDFHPHRRRARKSAWRAWWRRRSRRDQERIQDYEEKRALISHHEMILEEAMQEEIRQLRTAHGIVNSLVQAEEGRVILPRATGHGHCSCNDDYSVPPSPTSSTYTSDSLAGLSSRPLSRTSSLPGYHSDTSSAPPAYESDDDGADLVANGYRYNPSTTSNASTRWTPDSSVIDVSPRPSAETLRYLDATDTGGHESLY